ncbi:MAG: hypothetical protein Q7R95_11300 [bacterium]|nr:hypothetical protein [bacterium]
MNNKMPPIIVCAAMRDNKSGLIICGPRHYDLAMRAQIKAIYNDYHTDFEQGFVDQYSNFYTREQAWKIADAMGQIRRPFGLEQDYNTPRKANIGDEGVLFSESLY